MRWSAPDFSRHDDQAQAYLGRFCRRKSCKHKCPMGKQYSTHVKLKKNSSARTSSIAQTDFKSTHF